MNLINTLLLLTELVVKIREIEIEEKFQFDVRALKKLTNSSFIKKTSLLSSIKNYVSVNGHRVPVGTILKRPLDNVFQRTTLLNIEYHYAVVLGTSDDGEEFLIEMTKGRNVDIVTKQEFLANKFLEKEIGFYYIPQEEISRDYIFERAKHFEFEKYDLIDLNCKIFAEYIMWKISVPNRKLGLRKIQVCLCDFGIETYRLKLSNTENEKFFDFIKSQIEELEENKASLMYAVDKQIERTNEFKCP